jgi:hypothetical protein
MRGIEKYITKDGSKFYLDLGEWREGNDIPIDNGDIIKFSYENKKYIGKIFVNNTNNFDTVEINITKEM